MKCNLCGTHIFEGGESVDYEVRLAALKAAVVEAAMDWYLLTVAMGSTEPSHPIEFACAALAAAEKEG